MTSLTTPPLAEAFRAGSSAQHQAAETSSYIQAMIDGRITRSTHAAYCQALWHVYTAMEGVITSSDPTLAPFVDPALFRSESLAKDFHYYSPSADLPSLPVSTATQTYVDRILHLASHWPVGLLAHHYTRYLGDLAGGQMLKGCVAKALQPEAGLGLAAFEFPLILDTASYRAAYREKLNRLDVTSEVQSRLVEEVRHVFALNQSLFLELGTLLSP